MSVFVRFYYIRFLFAGVGWDWDPAWIQHGHEVSGNPHPLTVRRCHYHVVGTLKTHFKIREKNAAGGHFYPIFHYWPARNQSQCGSLPGKAFSCFFTCFSFCFCFSFAFHCLFLTHFTLFFTINFIDSNSHLIALQSTLMEVKFHFL